MNGTALLVLLLGGGVLAGAGLQRLSPVVRRRVMLITLGFASIPAGALALAMATGSHALGWLAGLGLMMLLTAGFPLLVGVMVGFVVFERRMACRSSVRTAHVPVTSPTRRPVPDETPAEQANDPASGVCVHLATVVASARAAGLTLRALGRRDLEVKATIGIQPPASLPDCVRADEVLRPDDRGVPLLRARLWCECCQSSLWLTHPAQATANTPHLFKLPAANTNL